MLKNGELRGVRDANQHTVGPRVVDLPRESTLGQHGKKELRNAAVDLDQCPSWSERLERHERSHHWLGRTESANVEIDRLFVVDRSILRIVRRRRGGRWRNTGLRRSP